MKAILKSDECVLFGTDGSVKTYLITYNVRDNQLHIVLTRDQIQLAQLFWQLLNNDITIGQVVLLFYIFS